MPPSRPSSWPAPWLCGYIRAWLVPPVDPEWRFDRGVAGTNRDRLVPAGDLYRSLSLGRSYRESDRAFVRVWPTERRRPRLVRDIGRTPGIFGCALTLPRRAP